MYQTLVLAWLVAVADQTGPSSGSLKKLAEVSGEDTLVEQDPFVSEEKAEQDPFVSEEKHSEGEEEEKKEGSASMRFQRIAVLTNDIDIQHEEPQTSLGGMLRRQSASHSPECLPSGRSIATLPTNCCSCLPYDIGYGR